MTDEQHVDQKHEERKSVYEEAADRATQAHPLPGEDLTTVHLEDADHWIRVYTELLAFKTSLIDEMERRVESMAPSAIDEVQRSDGILLVAEAERFRSRLTLWQQRRAELLNR